MDFNAFLEYRRDSFENGQRVNVAIGILKPADDWRIRPRELREVRLGETGFRTRVVDLSRDLGICKLSLERCAF